MFSFINKKDEEKNYTLHIRFDIDVVTKYSNGSSYYGYHCYKRLFKSVPFEYFSNLSIFSGDSEDTLKLRENIYTISFLGTKERLLRLSDYICNFKKCIVRRFCDKSPVILKKGNDVFWLIYNGCIQEINDEVFTHLGISIKDRKHPLNITAFTDSRYKVIANVCTSVHKGEHSLIYSTNEKFSEYYGDPEFSEKNGEFSLGMEVFQEVLTNGKKSNVVKDEMTNGKKSNVVKDEMTLIEDIIDSLLKGDEMTSIVDMIDSLLKSDKKKNDY